MSRSEGSTTVWALLVVVVLWLAAGVVTCLTTAVSVRHRASAAADAAALAGALDGDLSRGSACAAARAMAATDRAVIVDCHSKDGVVTVSTAVAAPAWMRWAGAAHGTARAGPVGIPGGSPQAGQRRNLAPAISLGRLTPRRRVLEEVPRCRGPATGSSPSRRSYPCRRSRRARSRTSSD